MTLFLKTVSQNGHALCFFLTILERNFLLRYPVYSFIYTPVGNKLKLHQPLASKSHKFYKASSYLEITVSGVL